MADLEIYEIDSSYIEYLSNFEEHLFKNKKITQDFSRKYIGIILEINGFKYFAPLSSFKPKHRRLCETEQIINNAKDVYNHKMINDGKSKLSQRCNDFKNLEVKCKEYKIPSKK